MVLQRIENGTTTDFSSQETEFSISASPVDEPGLIETYYTPDFSKWNGYYESIPEAKILVDTLIKWTLGKGYKGEAEKLKRIVGNGKENALRVFKNLKKVSFICGDSFGEIVKDAYGRITNIKPLNPDMTQIVYNSSGIIIGYNQLNLKGKAEHRWGVDEILHFCNGRVANRMGGYSLFQAIENLILARNEVISDLKIMFHRFVKPVRVWETETDNETQISAIAAKIDLAFKKTENIVVPKDVLKLAETSAIPTQTGGLSPIEYYRELVHVFISSCGVPEVILGWGADTTEATAKIIYLAWEQTIEELQKEFEEDIEYQLNVKITLEFPIDLMENIQSDAKKDKTTGEKKSEITPKVSKKEKEEMK